MTERLRLIRRRFKTCPRKITVLRSWTTRCLVLNALLVGLYWIYVSHLKTLKWKPVHYTTDFPILVNNDTKIILFWTQFFTHDDFYVGFGQKPFLDRQCPVNNCVTTNVRSYLSNAHAVIFHPRNINPYHLPFKRDPAQRFIFFHYESPMYTPVNLRQYNGFFNWTMTYRSDSDVPSRIEVIKLPPNLKEAFENVSHLVTPKHKTKLVAWIVSNCWTYGQREFYVLELRKYIQVDIYGKCGHLQSQYCSEETALETCYSSLEKDYKFYLSFENSYCRDYVTEKFHAVMNYHMVPIVFGGAAYAKFAPVHSYVDVLNFTSPKHLADYLLLLHNNNNLYGEYFKWKTQYRWIVDSVPWCQLCSKLHNDSEPSKIYNDIEKWWVRGGKCTPISKLSVMNDWTLTNKLKGIFTNLWLRIIDYTIILKAAFWNLVE